MSRVGILLSLLLALLVALLAYWFLSNFERRDADNEVGLRGEARTNPLLAAQRFFTRMGVAVHAVDNLQEFDALPPTRDSLLIWTQRETLGEQRAASLLQWVRAGGHLIVLARPPENLYEVEEDDEEPSSPLPDPLLDPLGIHSKNLQYDEDFDELVTDDKPLQVALRDEAPKALEVVLNASFRLDGALPGDQAVGDARGMHILHRRLEQGYISVLTSLDFMNNENIGQYDHAEFLWYLHHWRAQTLRHNWLRSQTQAALAALHGQSGTSATADTPNETPSAPGLGAIWLVQNDSMPKLPLWLWLKAQPVIIVFFIMLGIGIWYGAPRFGPIQPVPAPQRRRILEHIEAAGYYLWKHQRQQRLLTGVRGALSKRLSALHPGWVQFSEQEKEQHLAGLCDISQENVRQLLHQDVGRSAHNFTQLIQQLEAIRTRL